MRVFALSFGLLILLSGGGRTDPVLDVGLVRPGDGHRRSRAASATPPPRGKNFAIGAVPVAGVGGPLGSVPFRLQFQFDNDLPPIDVSGTVGSLGYNPMLPVLDPDRLDLGDAGTARPLPGRVSRPDRLTRTGSIRRRSATTPRR